jgi:TonB family protein
MRTWRRTNEPGVRSRNVVDRRNQTWNRALLIATAAAAGVHALLFVLWPAWQMVALRADPRTEMIQIQPIASYGAFMDEGDSRMAAAPSVEPQERALDMGDETGEAETEGDWADVFNFPASPSEREAFVPRAAEVPRESTAPPLNLELMISPRAEVVLNPGTTWPVIRNPTVLTRYLRSRFNPLFRSGNAGYVSVVMWIDERGAVGFAEVRESSGIAAIDAIALDAFSEIVAFTPARERGTPVPIAVTISVPFNAPW